MRITAPDGTVVTGIIDGGAGLDSRVYDINGVADLGALERRWLKDAFHLLHTYQEGVRIAFQADLIA